MGVNALARRQTEILLKYARDKLDVSAPLSRSQVMVRGLSAQGLEAVYSIIDDSLESIVSVLNDRKYRGEFVWSGVWSHQLLDGEKELYSQKLG